MAHLRLAISFAPLSLFCFARSLARFGYVLLPRFFSQAPLPLLHPFSPSPTPARKLLHHPPSPTLHPPARPDPPVHLQHGGRAIHECRGWVRGAGSGISAVGGAVDSGEMIEGERVILKLTDLVERAECLLAERRLSSPPVRASVRSSESFPASLRPPAAPKVRVRQLGPRPIALLAGIIYSAFSIAIACSRSSTQFIVFRVRSSLLTLRSPCRADDQLGGRQCKASARLLQSPLASPFWRTSSPWWKVKQRRNDL